MTEEEWEELARTIALHFFHEFARQPGAAAYVLTKFGRPA